MEKKETILFFHGRIKRRYRKPEKIHINTGLHSTSEFSGLLGMDIRPPRVHPLSRKRPDSLIRPYCAVPRLRRRFVLPAPGRVRRIVIATKEAKKKSLFYNLGEILPRGYKIIWRYNPWSDEYALGNASERIRDGWVYMREALITERSDRMRDVQYAFAVTAGLMFLLLGIGPRLVEGSMAASPIDGACAVRAVDVYCEGNYMGMVPSEESLEAELRQIELDLHDTYDMTVVVGNNITYKATCASNMPAKCLQETLSAVVKRLDVQVRAAAILVDGQVYGYLRDTGEAQGILDRIISEGKAAIETDSTDLEVVGFAENVEVREDDIAYNKVEMAQDIYMKLTEDRESEQVYTVESGDSLWGISDRYGMSVDELVALNPSMGNTLKVGAQLMVCQPDRVLDILTAETAVYDQDVPYEIIEEKRHNLYTTQTQLVRAGSSGISRVTARIYRCNGVEQSRDILTEEAISEPVDRIIAVGTKEPALFVDNSRGDGRYIWPTQGRLSSPFGWRWGRMHEGIDISNLRGTPIYAADGGTVIYAARKSGYGNFIIIYHGDGRETCYGHLNDYAVGTGDAVEKGQLIGYMGSTGRSTGNHLHFEIRINGKPQNPINFLN
jgi:murein DD-endopeptidase MepM/ murein hydrolase activator NlpD